MTSLQLAVVLRSRYNTFSFAFQTSRLKTSFGPQDDKSTRLLIFIAIGCDWNGRKNLHNRRHTHDSAALNLITDTVSIQLYPITETEIRTPQNSPIRSPVFIVSLVQQSKKTLFPSRPTCMFSIKSHQFGIPIVNIHYFYCQFRSYQTNLTLKQPTGRNRTITFSRHSTILDQFRQGRHLVSYTSIHAYPHTFFWHG